MKLRLRSWEDRLLHPTPCRDILDAIDAIQDQLTHARVYEPAWAQELEEALEDHRQEFKALGCR